MNNERIDEIIARYQGQPHSLIHVLMEIQSENHWLPKAVLDKVSKGLGVPLSRIMQIATFYKTFSLVPKGRHEVHVCTGSACHKRQPMISAKPCASTKPTAVSGAADKTLVNGP